MKKKSEHTAPPEFISVTATKTIQWKCGGRTHYVRGETYEMPRDIFNVIGKYFVVNDKIVEKPKEIEDGE